jgi:DNA polymerase-3 subunit alpha
VTGKEEVITQWSMGDVERAGLMKMDFLGLRYLTIVSKTLEIIARTRGEKLDPLAFPLDDPATFALLCRGETKGIFQLESGGIRDLLQRMKPDHFLDIVAVNALYRPGPLEGGMVDDYVAVKHGRQQAEYPHPVMKEVLEETHGVMVYQEQVMRILERLGGIELSKAYTCIKAISKKKHETIAAFREQFIEGARAKGLGKSEAADLFGLIEKFAGYGFNKSHSTAYALLAWQTAYLKTHYPTVPAAISKRRTPLSSISRTAAGWASVWRHPTSTVRMSNSPPMRARFCLACLPSRAVAGRQPRRSWRSGRPTERSATCLTSAAGSMGRWSIRPLWRT